MRAAWQPSAGDLIWTKVDPVRAGEPCGRDPALVVSAKAFTANTGLAIVCPITARPRSLPTSVVLPPGLPIAGEILVSHVRCIDMMARPVAFSGVSIDASLADEVRAKLAGLITI